MYYMGERMTPPPLQPLSPPHRPPPQIHRSNPNPPPSCSKPANPTSDPVSPPPDLQALDQISSQKPLEEESLKEESGQKGGAAASRKVTPAEDVQPTGNTRIQNPDLRKDQGQRIHPAPTQKVLNQISAEEERRYGQDKFQPELREDIDGCKTEKHSCLQDEGETYKSRFSAAQKGKRIQDEGGAVRQPGRKWFEIQQPSIRSSTSPKEVNHKQGLQLHNGGAFIAAGPNEDARGWIRVKPHHWWRKSPEHSSAQGKSEQPFQRISGSTFFKQKLQGKCFNCFSPEHVAGFCKALVRCWRCLHSGHKALECPSRRRAFRDKAHDIRKPTPQTHQPSGIIPKSSTSSLTKTYSEVVRKGTVMEARYPGDPRARPARAYCAISATGGIKRRRDELIDRAAVCWFDGNSHEVESFMVGDMLRERFDLRHRDVQLLKHFPEQFLVIFSEAAVRRRVVGAAKVTYRGRTFHFAAWTEQRYATNVNFEFHVKVRVEGIPVHCWCEEVAARALGRSCAIHYIQERTRRRERTRSFNLWAWCSDPSDIPKEVSLTVMEPDKEQQPISIPLPQVTAYYDDPTDLKRGQVFILRNHLEVVEDLTFLRGRGCSGGLPNRKQRREFVWSYGAPDEIGERRDSLVQGGGRGRDRHRRFDDHDDDDHNREDHRRSTRRHRSLSTWVRDSRCRGGVEDCHSASWRGNGGSSTRRYRQDLTPSQQLFIAVNKPSCLSKKPEQGNDKKKVTFAEPVVAELKKCWGGTDKMKETSSCNQHQMGLQFASHFEKPMSKEKVDAILELVNQGMIK